MANEEWSLAKARWEAIESVLRTDELRTRRPRVVRTVGDYRVRCYRSNYFEEFEPGAPRRREVEIIVNWRDETVAVGRLVEWEVPFGTNEYDFWWAADSMSQIEGELAYLIASYWSYDEWPPDFGTIALFDRLAVRTSVDPERQALRLIRAMIERELGSRASILVLKAFPLEYENEPDHPNRQHGLRERRIAMMRWYANRLGVTPFVDQGEFEGWMWRPLRYCPDPTRVTADDSWLSR